MKKIKIRNLIGLIWFVLSVICAFVLSQKNMLYILMMIGQYFFMYGVFFSERKGKRLFDVFVYPSVGIMCIVIAFLMMNPEVLNIKLARSIFLILILSVFIIPGSYFIFVPMFEIRYLKKVCVVKVSAVLKKYNYNRLSDGIKVRMVYSPVYEFKYKGKVYEVFKEKYVDVKAVPKGTDVTLLINPDNPNEFLDDSHYSKAVIFLGMIFFLGVLLVLYFIFNGNIL